MKYDATIMLIIVLLTNCSADKKYQTKGKGLLMDRDIFLLFFSLYQKRDMVTSSYWCTKFAKLHCFSIRKLVCILQRIITR